MIEQVSKGSDWVKVTFEITLLTADPNDLNRVCDDLTGVIGSILEMQRFPVVDAVEDVTFKIEDDDNTEVEGQ